VSAMEVEAAMVNEDVQDEVVHLFIDMHRQLMERTIICDICGKVLEEPGALLFEPPAGIPSRSVKNHICVDCVPRVKALIKELAALTNPE